MLLSLAAVACQPGDETRLELTVRADAALQLDHVDITVTGGSRKPLTRRFPILPAKGSATTAPDVTWEVTVSSLTSTLVATVEVQGLVGGSPVIELVAEANLSPRSQVDALLRLTNSCRKDLVPCVASGQTCIDGACQPHPVFGKPGDSGIEVVLPDAAPDTSSVDRAPAADAADARDARTPVDGGDGGAGPALNGAPCGKGTDCTSGNCVETVCCDKPCADVCTSCRNALTAASPDGTCAVIASSRDDAQGRCGAPTVAGTCGNTSHCDGKGACEKYGTSTICAAAACSATGAFTPASTCDGNGVCAAAPAQDCKGFACTAAGGCATACTVDLDCTGGYCTAAKTCATKQIDGASCLAGNECVHGQCVGGICCATACDGLCVSCSNSETNAPSGQCKPIVAGGSSKGKCAPDATACGHDGTCDGNGACRFRVSATTCGAPACTNGQLVPAPLCDGAGLCAAAAAATACAGGVGCASVTACKSATCVADADCVSTRYCLNGACVAKQANGGSCSANNQCSAGNCLGTICCESSCAATCTSCVSVDTGAADGLCRPIKVGLGSKGKCAVSATTPCGNDGSCDGAGQCAPARSGTNCGTPSCLNAALRAAPTCNGSGACVTPTTTTPCAGGVVCGSAVACGATTCAKDTDCAAGNYCALAGTTGTCMPTKANGASCVLGNECALGSCVGSICCETACTGTCMSCAAVDTNLANGLCRPTQAGGSSKGKCAPGAAPCGQDGTCNGSGGCRFPPVTTSCADPLCTGSQLRPALTCNGSGTCGTATAAPCPGGVLCGSTTACKPASCAVDADCVSNFCVGTTCTPKKANGQACLAARECVSGACADGVCCNTTCQGSCEFCNVSTVLAGTCSLVSGAPRTGHAACTGAAPCGASCNGQVASCTFAATTTSCRSAGCVNGASLSTATRAANCDGLGNCPAASTVTCNPFLCGGNACATTCTSNAQCATGAACVNGGCRACTGQTVCPNACVDLTSDSSNCGACGHSCLSGLCVNSACQPFAIVSNLTGVPGPLQLDGTNIIWTEGDTSQVFSIDTSTLARRTLFPGLRVAYRLSGNTIVSKFGSSFTTFNTCTLSSNCPTFTMLSPANTTGGDFRIDNATQKLFFVDLSFPDMVQASSFVTWNPAMFLTLPVGFNSVGLLAQLNGFLYGTALPNAGGPLVFWRASTASATNTAAILSTQIPGNVGFPVVGANATKLFYLTDSGLILSFPPNGSGNAVPNTFFNAGIQGGMAVDDSFVYWSDYVIGNVYRCSAALTVCTTPEIIASGQPSASSLVQDAKALYWQRAQQSPMHQIMRWAK